MSGAALSADLIDQQALMQATGVGPRKLKEELRKAGVPHYVVNGRVFTTSQALTKGLLESSSGAGVASPRYGALTAPKRS